MSKIVLHIQVPVLASLSVVCEVWAGFSFTRCWKYHSVYTVASYPGCLLLAVLGVQSCVQDFFSLHAMGYISENAVALRKAKEIYHSDVHTI